MKSIFDDARDAVVAFGVICTILSTLWSVGFAASTTTSSGSTPLPLVILCSTLLGAAAGGITWVFIVGRWNKWTTPTRGAIAGAVTFWVTFSVMVPVVVLIDQRASLTLSIDVVLEVLGLMMLVSTVGMLFIGIFLLPIGSFIGYVLAHNQMTDPGPLPVVSRFR